MKMFILLRKVKHLLVYELHKSNKTHRANLLLKFPQSENYINILFNLNIELA